MKRAATGDLLPRFFGSSALVAWRKRCLCEVGYLARGIFEYLGEVTLDTAILARASQSMPVPSKTLDALHIASALRLREAKRELVFVSHDAQQSTAAKAVGLPVDG